MVVSERADFDADRMFHALADPTRRDIVRRTLQDDLSVSEIARGYPMRHSAVQKHVAVLERAGLVHGRRAGREKVMAADPQALRAAEDALHELAGFWRDRFRAMDEILADERRAEGGTR